MIFYYTGTGNSRYAALLLADLLDDTAVDAAPYLKSGLAASLSSQRPWVFVCPTYAWQMPRVFAALLRRSSFAGNRSAYFVLTCGSDIGAAGRALERLSDEIALEYRGVLPLVMPENYVAMFPVPQEEQAAPIVEAAHAPLAEAARQIAAEQPFPQWGRPCCRVMQLVTHILAQRPQPLQAAVVWKGRAVTQKR